MRPIGAFISGAGIAAYISILITQMVSHESGRRSLARDLCAPLEAVLLKDGWVCTSRGNVSAPLALRPDAGETR